MSLRDIILQAKDCPITPLEVSEWKTTVYIKTLSAGERLQLEKDMSAGIESQTLTFSRIACAVLCDEQGNMLFKYPDEIELVDTKSPGALEKVFDEGLKRNFMKKQDIEDLKKG